MRPAASTASSPHGAGASAALACEPGCAAVQPNPRQCRHIQLHRAPMRYWGASAGRDGDPCRVAVARLCEPARGNFFPARIMDISQFEADSSRVQQYGTSPKSQRAVSHWCVLTGINRQAWMRSSMRTNLQATPAAVAMTVLASPIIMAHSSGRLRISPEGWQYAAGPVQRAAPPRPDIEGRTSPPAFQAGAHGSVAPVRRLPSAARFVPIPGLLARGLKEVRVKETS
jgi:hypothetical protein